MLLRKAGYAFHTSAEREVVRTIKEAACYIAFKPSEAEEQAKSGAFAPAKFALPDGNVLQLGAECFRAPELLFDPSLLGLEYPGVHECLNNAIMKSDMDLRRILYTQIVLAGGSTLFKGVF